MSSYQVIARKWRPQTFADVVGQEHITRTLRNAILQDRVGQAYLFTGPRGTGKTTTARIFAKALNCQNRRPDAEPCCECPSCREITGGQALDVVEIDAASNNSVDDIRDLRDNVHYTPVLGKFRIYIMDEAHMLSTQAWNALLKTLEEPPAHVKFIFATTEVHKILPTILSRCQRLDIKPIPNALIAERLRRIADEEKIAIEDAAIDAIARVANGGMRDSQSCFDQMISFCSARGQAITEADVIDVFGLASGHELGELAAELLRNDLGGVIRFVQEFADRGRDLENLLEEMIRLFRDLMVIQLYPRPEAILQGGAHELPRLQALANSAPADLIRRMLEGLMTQETFVRYALNKRVAIEVAFVRVLREAHSVTVDDVLQRLRAWKEQGVEFPVPAAAVAPWVSAPAALPAPVPAPTPAAVPPPAPPPPPTAPPAPPKPVPAPPKPAPPPPPLPAPAKAVTPMPPPAAAAAAPGAESHYEAAAEPEPALSVADSEPPADFYDNEAIPETTVEADEPPPPPPPPVKPPPAAAAPDATAAPRLRADPEVWAKVQQDPFVQKVSRQFQAKIIDVRG